MSQDYEQVIASFEQRQRDYQAALEAREIAKQNEELQLAAYFYQQQALYEQAQKRDRRCQIIEGIINSLGSIVQEVEWGNTNRLNEQLRNLEAHIEFQLRNRILENGG